MNRPTNKAILAAALVAAGMLHAQAAENPNILFITADDMNFDSVGVYGCPVEGITPNLDRLSGEGMRFEYAYTPATVCQPSRQTMQCGLYPHRSGSVGNDHPLKPEVTTLNQRLHEAGYLISMISKVGHNQPRSKFYHHFLVEDLWVCRNPEMAGKVTELFLAMCKARGQPFFHNINLIDPHRPFIGAKGPDDLAGGAEPSRWIRPEEISRMPGFLEDLPKVREEVAQYYTNVRRLDDCVGAVLAALDESGMRDRTLVVFFGGDHGMALPYGKSNLYENSMRGSLILRWPGVIKPGRVDRQHFVSTIDFVPTLLEAAGLDPIPGIDGRSFLPAIKGEPLMGDWDTAFGFYHKQGTRNWVPMRSIRTREFSYIWNGWSDGEKAYRAENMAGLTWNAMVKAGKSDPAIQARVDHYLYRTPEEFYRLTDDPCERNNLIDNPEYKDRIEAMRAELLKEMKRTGDPLLEAMQSRGDRAAYQAAIGRLRREYPDPEH